MNTSCLTNLCTRTIQDIFEMFALFAFVVDGLTELMHNFGEHYFSEACSRQSEHGGMTGVWALTGQLEGRSTMSRTMPTTTPMREETTGTGLGFLNYLLPDYVQEKRDVDYFVGSGVAEDLGMTSPSVVTSTTPSINMASSTIVQLIQEVLNVTLSTTSSTTTTHPTINHAGPTLHDDDPNLPPHLHDENECRRDRALLYLLLMLATWWSSLRLHSFAKTPYLNKKVRDFLADYSLPLSIIGVSVGGRLFFGDVQRKSIPLPHHHFFNVHLHQFFFKQLRFLQFTTTPQKELKSNIFPFGVSSCVVELVLSFHFYFSSTPPLQIQ